jgi:hypothetical protein
MLTVNVKISRRTCPISRAGPLHVCNYAVRFGQWVFNIMRLFLTFASRVILSVLECLKIFLFIQTNFSGSQMSDSSSIEGGGGAGGDHKGFHLEDEEEAANYTAPQYLVCLLRHNIIFLN